MKARNVVSSTQEARRRSMDSLCERLNAARAARVGVSQVAEQNRRRAEVVETGVPLPALIEVYAQADAAELLWVTLDSPRALEELAAAAGAVQVRAQERGKPQPKGSLA